MNKNNDKIWLIIGIILIGVGALFAAFSIITISKYDKAEALISIETHQRSSGKKNKQAYLTYTYNGKIYSDVHINTYNGFTMKDGKNITIYIDPNKPENPKTTDFLWTVICCLIGAASLFAYFKGKRKIQ